MDMPLQAPAFPNAHGFAAGQFCRSRICLAAGLSQSGFLGCRQTNLAGYPFSDDDNLSVADNLAFLVCGLKDHMAPFRIIVRVFQHGIFAIGKSGDDVNVKEALVILKGQNSALSFQNLTV